MGIINASARHRQSAARRWPFGKPATARRRPWENVRARTLFPLRQLPATGHHQRTAGNPGAALDLAKAASANASCRARFWRSDEEEWGDLNLIGIAIGTNQGLMHG